MAKPASKVLKLSLLSLVLMALVLTSYTTAECIPPSREGQTSSTTLTVLPLVQNGNTQNHFVIDKSQFKKAPEF